MLIDVLPICTFNTVIASDLLNVHNGFVGWCTDLLNLILRFWEATVCYVILSALLCVIWDETSSNVRESDLIYHMMGSEQ